MVPAGGDLASRGCPGHLPRAGHPPSPPPPTNQAMRHSPAHTCPAPAWPPPSLLLPHCQGFWPGKLPSAPSPPAASPALPPGQAGPHPQGQPGALWPGQPLHHRPPLLPPPALSQPSQQPGHHCQGWGSDRGGGAPGTPSLKAVGGGVVREASDPASARRRRAGRVPRPPPHTQSPVVVSAQPEGPCSQRQKESQPTPGLSHPAGPGEGPGPALPRGVPPAGHRAPRPRGPASAQLSSFNGAVTSFLPSSSQTGTGAAPALLLP